MDLKEEVVNMKKEVKEVKNQSLAREMLEDYKKQNKRLFIIIIVILCMWFATGCYLVYILNDIGKIETVEEITQDNSDGYNNYIGNDGNINNGKTEDKEDN